MKNIGVGLSTNITTRYPPVGALYGYRKSFVIMLFWLNKTTSTQKYMKTLWNRVWKFLVSVNKMIDEKANDYSADYAYRSWILALFVLISILVVVSSIGNLTFFIASLIGLFDFGRSKWYFAIFALPAIPIIWYCVYLANHSSWHLYRNLFSNEEV
jgi:hypothetical protein